MGDELKAVFVSHPYAAASEQNARLVLLQVRRLAVSGFVPIAPQIYLPQFIDEAGERDLAMRLCLALVKLSEEVRVYGEPSAGMKLEIAEAVRLGIPVVDGTTGEGLGQKGEPPR